MTLKEYVIQNDPGMKEAKWQYWCPSECGLDSKWNYCGENGKRKYGDGRCKVCWNQEYIDDKIRGNRRKVIELEDWWATLEQKESMVDENNISSILDFAYWGLSDYFAFLLELAKLQNNDGKDM